MKRVLLFIFTVLLFCLNGYAQPYGNEWIHFNQTYLKFPVVNDGVYRINYSTLQTGGVPLSSITGANFQVFARGQQVPIYVSNNGTFTSTDYIEFFAQHNDGFADSSLYAVKSWQANPMLSLFNDTISYFLTWNTSTTNFHYTNYTNTLNAHPAKENWCWFTSTDVLGGGRAASGNYFTGKPAYQGQQIFNSDFSDAEGYADYTVSHGTATYAVYTPFPYTGGPAPTLNACWLSRYPLDHYMNVSVGSQLLQSYHDFGFHTTRVSLTVPTVSLITSGSTNVYFSTANSPTNVDANCVSFAQLQYPRTFNADGKTSMLFSFDPSGTNRYFEVYNFNSSGTTPVLYDMTNGLRLTALESTDGDTLKFQIPSSSVSRNLLLVAYTTTGVINTVNTLYPVHFVDYSLSANQGDFVIISHPFFFNDGSGNNYVDQYRQFKSSNGYHAIVVDVTSLYDEFAYGINLHPSSIRNFSQYMKNKWTSYTNKHIFLIGKGIEMYNYNNDITLKPICYVPTYGYPGSDVMLTATNFDPTPQIPIGRIPALTTDEVRIYLKKAQDLLSQQNGPQTIEAQGWMKHAVHLGGGENAQDQSIFQYYLNRYIPVFQDSTYYGGTVTSFFKTSSDPIQEATSSLLDSLINNGVSLITFFGHSSYNSFDYDLGPPTTYNNYKKYPVLVSNGCLVGNMFNAGTGVSDEFVFAEDRGTIAFIAAATFSVSNSLDNYTYNFYANFCNRSYNQTLGNIMKNDVRDILNFGATGIDTVVLEQMCLDGDPSLLMNSHPKPDYVIEPQSISFNPTVVSAGLDSFKLQVVITNIGKAIKDSFFVDVTRTFPNGQSYLAGHKKVLAPYYMDTVVFSIQTQSLVSLGLNKFDIKVDATNLVNEISETNNELSVNLLILSDDLVPVYPYDLSIVNKQGITLKASTVNAFATTKQYVMEIDTTQNFNSHLKLHYKTNQIGGVVQWTPGITLRDSTVYYWRTSLDTIYHNSYSWHNSSFIYINGSSPGWNQSHYFQYLPDTYGNITLPSTRKFTYVSDIKTVSVFNAISSLNYPPGPVTWDEINYFINGAEMAGWTCGTQANLLFAVIDSSTGLQWQSVYNTATGEGSYGDIHSCYTYNFNCFYFDGTGQSDGGFQRIINFINLIPKGDYVLVMSLNDPQIYNFPANLQAAFQSIGAIRMDSIKSAVPYVLFSKKGSRTYPTKEIIGKNFNSIIDTSFQINGLWDNGFVESPIIGPAVKWTSLHWKSHQLEPNSDIYTLNVFGVDNTGKQTLLFKNVVHPDTVISSISAKLYPYLQLKLNTQDTIHRTPLQLNDWRINYQPVPEAAINPLSYFTFTDTVAQLQNMKLNVAIQNVSDYSMDSLEMKYTITDSKNVPHIVYQKLDSLRKGDTLHTKFSFPISGNNYSGINNVIVEANPLDKNNQPEQYHFNNVAALHFTTTKDAINPLLDVTFDGIHILDGDIVSARPDILIRLNDNNKQLALNDTSLLKIYYQYPDGSKQPVVFDGHTNVFTPADPTNLQKINQAQAELKPILTTDGTYKIFVQGYDRTGNAAGAYDYQISFQVINKSMISNVLNYPNPFTTQTHFVFTLTGSVIPTFMKIQIMTVTGKVVKEIFENELGPIHIGTNITEYAWNGTDKFGSPLANGLYFYKVVTNLDNKQIDKYEVNNGSLDQYFKHDIGKMYFMR